MSSNLNLKALLKALRTGTAGRLPFLRIFVFSKACPPQSNALCYFRPERYQAVYVSVYQKEVRVGTY